MTRRPSLVGDSRPNPIESYRILQTSQVIPVTPFVRIKKEQKKGGHHNKNGLLFLFHATKKEKGDHCEAIRFVRNRALTFAFKIHRFPSAIAGEITRINRLTRSKELVVEVGYRSFLKISSKNSIEKLL